MKELLVLTAFALPAAAAPPPGIPHSELALGGVSLDATEQQILSQLGQPTSVTEELDFLNRHLHYPNLLISFSGSIVAGLFSASPDACTPAGLCPGDPLAHALTLYGAPEIVERETGTFWEYYTSFPCWLQIAPEGDRIASIRVACQP